MSPRRRRGRLGDEAGYTIAELVVAAFMATFVLTVVFAAVRVQGRGAAMQSGVADTQVTARGAGRNMLIANVAGRRRLKYIQTFNNKGPGLRRLKCSRSEIAGSSRCP